MNRLCERFCDFVAKEIKLREFLLPKTPQPLFDLSKRDGEEFIVMVFEGVDFPRVLNGYTRLSCALRGCGSTCCRLIDAISFCSRKSKLFFRFQLFHRTFTLKRRINLDTGC